ncbi:hypothetical protein SAMN05660477_00919 [Soonwooa buanensis]|uniref:YhhN-like protein n=1 Tax=Soonwooa buanensis TaxID=619805 RepID=A0A1T5DQI6_9FLAO|nr:hypothetical protein [Soonwooa buanensis]SKB73786.1 hypothetical protein SAMN05660477_00919 [Soonwooa buanensis]
MLILYIYLFVVFLCFVSSIINRKTEQHFLWLYFATVFTCENLNKIELMPYSLYIFTIPLYSLFFIYYFGTEEKNKKFSWILAIINIILSAIFFGTEANYQIILSVILCVTYTFLSLRWFFLQLKNTDVTPIYKKQKFWVATSLLFFSIVFIFRIVPTNLLNVMDVEFLQLITKSFMIAVIISYLLLLKATTCKI